MLYFNACERCRGTMVLESDLSGEYVACLHCGHVEYTVPAITKSMEPVEEAPATPVPIKRWLSPDRHHAVTGVTSRT